MLTWPPRFVRFACGVCLCLLGLSSIAAAQAPKVLDEAAAESKLPAAKDSAVEQLEAKKRPAKKRAAKKPGAFDPPAYDYSRLAHPDIAEQLELTDQQRAEVARLINVRVTETAGAAQSKRAEIIRNSDRQLAALLNEGQLAKLAEIAGPRKLKFNFRYQKWDEVLDWFARQAGLELVMNQPPAGEFTYSANRSFTPTQAVDLLNSVLLTKGFALIKRGRMLILIELSDQMPKDLIPDVTVEDIPNHGDFEFIKVAFKLGRRPADGVAKEIEPLIGKYGTCFALPQTGQLLVTETAGKMRAISIVIASIPEPALPEKPKEKPKPPPPILGVYPVTTIEPQAVVEALATMFPNAKFVIDDKGDVVLAYGTPGEQAAIKAAVDQMQANRPAGTQPVLEVYPVDLPNLDEVVEQFKTMLPDVQVVADPTLGRLLVVAAPAEQEKVKAAIEKLGGGIDASAKHVLGVYHTPKIDPAAAVETLAVLFPNAKLTVDQKGSKVLAYARPDEQAAIKEAVSQMQSTGPPEQQPRLEVYAVDLPGADGLSVQLQTLLPDAMISFDPTLERLFVFADPDDQAKAKEMIDKLGAAVDMSAKQLVVYQVKHFDPSALATLIKELIPRAKVTLDPKLRRVVVTTLPAQQAIVKALVDQLDRDAAIEDKRVLNVYRMDKPVDATVVATLQAMIPEAQVTLGPDGRQLTIVARVADQTVAKKLVDQWQEIVAGQEVPSLKIYPLEETLGPAVLATFTEIVPDAKVTLSPGGRQLQVVALAADQVEVAKLIEQLQQAVTAEGKPELAVLPLRKPLDATVLATLKTIVPKAQITMSSDARQLIVVADQVDRAALKRTLDQIEISVGAAGKKQLEVYKVEGFTAAELNTLLQPLVVASTIMVDTPLDRLIIWGPADEHAAFVEVMDKLRADPLAGTKPVLDFYSVPNEATSTSVAALLTTLAPTAKVTWDGEGQRMMVIATPKDQQVARQTIEQVLGDAPPAEKQVLRIYTLTATQRTRFQAVEADVVKEHPGMRVIRDPQTGELAVWAKSTQHDELTKIFDQLKGSGDASTLRLLIAYPIRRGSAKAVADVLQSVYPSMKVRVDEKSDQVLVHATLREQGQIKQTIAQLDVEPSPDNQDSMRSYSTGDSDPAVLVPMLQTLVPNMQLNADPGGKRIIASGRARDHATLARTIEQFRTGDPSQRPTVKVYAVKDRSSQSLFYLRSVLAQIAPDAVITFDTRGGSIIASANEKQHELIREAIDQMVKNDDQAAPILETYQLDKVKAAHVIATLGPIVPEAKISDGMALDQIVVWATAEDHQKIKAALEKLEASADGDGARVLRLHRIRPAVAAQAATFIATTLPGLQLLAGQGTGRVLVWGTPKDHARLEELIKQMDTELGLDVKRVMKAYDLDDVSPTEAQRVLDAAIAGLEYLAGGTPDRLVIRAEEADHVRVEEKLEELKKVLAAPEQIVKVHRFEPEKADVAAIYAALSPDDMKDLSIQVYAVSNSLVVRGPAKRQAELTETVNQLVQQLPAPDQPVSEVYRLERADPTAVSTMVLTLIPTAVVATDIANRTLAVTATLKEHAKIRSVVEELDTIQGGELVTATYVLKRANPTAMMTAITPIVPRATISSDIYNKMLIVTATAKEQEQIKAIVEQADGRGEGELSTKAYPLKWANSSTISVALGSVVPNAMVSADTLNKMLIVTASEKDHERIRAVLDQADQRGGGALTTKAYRLQTANPTTIMTALGPVVPNATVSSDVTNSLLIVTASDEDHTRIKAIVDEADLSDEGERTTVVYSLKWANPTALSASIKPIAPNATAVPDIYNKTLIVTAAAKDHQRIKAVVDQADKRGGGELITKAYTMAWANTTVISTALSAVVPDATISSDIYNKMVIVTATQEDHDKIQAVLDQADKRGGGELITRAYTLQIANPSAIMLSLRPVVPNATISSDVTNNMLIVTASDDDHARIKAVVDEADRRADGDLITEVYSLKWANATALSTALRPIAPNATLSPDIYNKTLIVTASAKEHEQIKAVVEKADTRGGGEMITTAYSLKWTNVTTIATALTAVVPEAKISSDITNKMLIVTAVQEDHDKIQAVLDQADKRGGGDLVTKAYALQVASPSTLLLALRPVVPDATLAADATSRVLIATASEEDHLRIKTVLDEADRKNDGELVTEAYALKYANPLAIMTAIQPIVPNATLGADSVNKTLIVAATAKDQQRVKTVIEQADRRGGGEMTTQVYLLNRANPLYLQRALLPLVPDATIGSDAVSKMLIVTAPEEDQAKIKAVVEQADRRGEGDLTTRVYPFKLASPASVAAALRSLIPGATLSSDATTNTLIVTATDEDHKQIDALVKELDVADPNARVLKSYHVDNADPQEVYQSLMQLFRVNREVSVGYQTDTGMILVFAPSAEQEEVGRAILEIDQSVKGRPEATLEVYSLEDVDGDAAVETLRALLKDETPKVDLQIDLNNNQVLAIAEPAQHETIRKALSQLTPEQREMEVFTLQHVDPFTAESAVGTLFADLPFAATPSVEADPDTQQLIVRATKKQLERIRGLLEKMGEGAESRRGTSRSSVRVIPMAGDVESMLKEMKGIWPQVRGNPMKIVVPSEAEAEAEPESKPSKSTDVDPAAAGGKPGAKSAKPKGPAPESKTPPPPGPAKDAKQRKTAGIDAVPAVFVSAPIDAQQPPNVAPAQTPAASAGPRADARGEPRPGPSRAADSDLAPIVVIAGKGRITIASSDREALDQFESLMKTIQRGRRISITTGRFSMYLLRNADAKELAEVLTQLFRQGARSGARGSYRSSARRSSNVQIVADQRMNALLVYGSMADRGVVEELLEVLDSIDLPESLTAERPRMIPIKNLPATRVLVVLNSVYKTLLTARRGLRPVSIPQGISPEMQSMLELLNATANAPLLTLDTDETSNSIVMRAPRQLGEEIEAFIKELDEQAEDGGTRSISLIPLKGMSSEQVQDALRLLMRGGRYRGRSSIRGR